MNDLAISVEGVSKVYRIWENPTSRLTSPLLAGLADALPRRLGTAMRERSRRAYRDFSALHNVSFDVRRGESVGIIGRNGSGKSTLLQIIAGTLQPTAGSARINGRVAALLELGSGFNEEFTGRENVYLNGAVIGLSRTEIDAKFSEIEAFADIGDFIDQAVKTYSSGMMVRLAFAVQTAIEPDILIVDEALSVGDFFFQQKCFERIAQLRDKGTTILFVSHDTASVRNLCSRTLLLRSGNQEFFGETQEAIARYFLDTANAPSEPAKKSAPRESGSIETFLAEAENGALFLAPDRHMAVSDAKASRVISLGMTDHNGLPSSDFTMGSQASIVAHILSREDEEIHFSVEIKNRHGQIVSVVSSRLLAPPPVTGRCWRFEAQVTLALEAGEYSLQGVLGKATAHPNVGIRVDATPWLGPIRITWDYENKQAPFLGMFNLPAIVALDPECDA